MKARIQDIVFAVQIALLTMFVLLILTAIILSFTSLAYNPTIQDRIALVGGLSLFGSIAFFVFVTLPVGLATN